MPVTRTNEGYLQIPAKISRTGIYEYGVGELRSQGVPLPSALPEDAICRVYRSREEVFNKASLLSFAAKPVTLDHPTEHVTPRTFAEEAIGLTDRNISAGDDGYVHVPITLYTDRGISAYTSGTRQLSCGYTAGIRLQGGMTDAGEPYDAIQTQISGNHVALVEQGRAGGARLLDREITMADTNTNAVELGKVQQQLADALAQNGELKKKNDELQGQVVALQKTQVTDADIEARAQELLKKKEARKALVDRAKTFAPQLVVTDATTDRDLMVAAIRARDAEIQLDGLSDEFVHGVFSALKAPHTDSATQQVSGGVPPYVGIPAGNGGAVEQIPVGDARCDVLRDLCLGGSK